LKIQYLESVDSTQTYLKNLVKNNCAVAPCAVVSKIQTNGLGSRDNAWTALPGNLFLSFCVSIDDLPIDLKLESASIYFAYILKETLETEGSRVWLKWPNDFYVGELKIGGIITNLVNGALICGVGLNLVVNPKGFATLDIEIKAEELLEKYFINVEKKILWKQVFSKYKLEFYKSQNFSTHANNLRISLRDAFLQDDGSIMSNNERIYSIR
jgi:BirA family transcriptional regulator, biotin operon repressor / biotin---[acetyl-CoA-carboxylase] ligase